MEDGCITLDSEFGEKIDFTSDKFKNSWLWKKGNYIYISMLWSKEENKGYTVTLFDNILKEGYGIKVPTPFPKMVSICAKRGFKYLKEKTPEGDCNILIKEAIK